MHFGKRGLSKNIHVETVLSGENNSLEACEIVTHNFLNGKRKSYCSHFILNVRCWCALFYTTKIQFTENDENGNQEKEEAGKFIRSKCENREALILWGFLPLVSPISPRSKKYSCRLCGDFNIIIQLLIIWNDETEGKKQKSS